jgi:hypothetical protein
MLLLSELILLQLGHVLEEINSTRVKLLCVRILAIISNEFFADLPNFVGEGILLLKGSVLLRDKRISRDTINSDPHPNELANRSFNLVLLLLDAASAILIGGVVHVFMMVLIHLEPDSLALLHG